MYRAVEPYRRVIEAVNGFQGARILHQGVRFDLFSRVADEGKTVMQLARPLGSDPRALELLLNALVAMGFLRKESERYHATPLSQTYLVRGGPKYIGSLVLYQARRWTEWEHLEDAIRTGRPVREPDLYQGDPEDLKLFVHGLHELALARGDARYLAHVLPLQNVRKLADLGGGPGTYAAMLCRTYPKLRAVVVDQPATLKISRRILERFDTTGRVTTSAADILRDPIRGGPFDAALVSNVLHGEDEKTSARLLRKARDLLVPGGLLIVREHCMSPDRTEPEGSAVFALALLLGTRGRTYSFAEMAAWIRAAGFLGVVEIPPEPPMTASLLLAVRPGEHPVAVLPRASEDSHPWSSARFHHPSHPIVTAASIEREPSFVSDAPRNSAAAGLAIHGGLTAAEWSAPPRTARPPASRRATKPRPRTRTAKPSSRARAAKSARSRSSTRASTPRPGRKAKPAARGKPATGAKSRPRKGSKRA